MKTSTVSMSLFFICSMTLICASNEDSQSSLEKSSRQESLECCANGERFDMFLQLVAEKNMMEPKAVAVPKSHDWTLCQYLLTCFCCYKENDLEQYKAFDENTKN